jgi:hypothetical protein
LEDLHQESKLPYLGIELAIPELRSRWLDIQRILSQRGEVEEQQRKESEEAEHSVQLFVNDG